MHVIYLSLHDICTSDSLAIYIVPCSSPLRELIVCLFLFSYGYHHFLGGWEVMVGSRRSGTSGIPPLPNQENNETLIAQLTAAMAGVMEQKVQEARDENKRQLIEMFEQFKAEMLGNRGVGVEGNGNGEGGPDGERSMGQHREGQGSPSLSQAQGGLGRPTPEDLSLTRVWKDVARHNPPVFSGVDSSPQRAESYIQRLETIFTAVECTTYQKAKVAISQLTERAKRW